MISGVGCSVRSLWSCRAEGSGLDQLHGRPNLLARGGKALVHRGVGSPEAPAYRQVEGIAGPQGCAADIAVPFRCFKISALDRHDLQPQAAELFNHGESGLVFLAGGLASRALFHCSGNWRPAYSQEEPLRPPSRRLP